MKYLAQILLASLIVLPAQAKPVPAWLEPMPIGAVLKFVSASATCSAVAVAPYEALTAAHCIHKGATMTLRDILGHLHRVHTATEHPTEDVALLTVLSGSGPFAELAVVSNSIPTRGELAFVAGYGCFGKLDIRPVVFGGYTDATFTDIEVTGDICHGDSGGPMFNAKGELIAVNRAMLTLRVPLAYEAPVHALVLATLRSAKK
jgi:hypothetical protein